MVLDWTFTQTLDAAQTINNVPFSINREMALSLKTPGIARLIPYDGTHRAALITCLYYQFPNS